MVHQPTDMQKHPVDPTDDSSVGISCRPQLAPEAWAHAAECLKTLAHPHRLRAVQMLLERRCTVGELADACGIPSAMMSEHLRLMQRCGFLACEPEGRKRFYEVIEPHLASIISCIESRFSQMGDQPAPRCEE